MFCFLFITVILFVFPNLYCYCFPSSSKPSTSRLSSERQNVDSAPRSPREVEVEETTSRLKSFITAVGTISAVYSSGGASNAATEGAKKTIGYQAAESVFAPLSSLDQYIVPTLPQSALLNKLPIQPPIELIGQIQGFLESYVQLIPPNNKKQLDQIERNDSALWNNLRTNAQRATGMFLYNENELEPIVEKSSDIPFQELIEKKRQKYGTQFLDELKFNLIELVSVSRKSNRPESVSYMKAALTSLYKVAYLQVPLLESYNKATEGKAYFEEIRKAKENGQDKEKEAEDNEFAMKSRYICAPQLIGHAAVKLKFLLKNKVPAEFAVVYLIVDGINYPITAGNFIDLCQKGVYNQSPISIEQIDFGRKDEVVTFSVIGNSEKDYWDLSRNKRRNIPLEVHREVPENNNRITTLGGAQNSAVFTPAAPVQAFSTYGSIGMWHRPGDLNGASSAIFSAKLDRVAVRPTAMDKLPLLQRLDNRYSLFAYAVDGGEVLDQLSQGDILVSAVVEDGPWALVQI